MTNLYSVESATTLPIVLCHPACSGGSLIYRHLVAATGCVSVHEVGHHWLPRPEDFGPLDPESQLTSMGKLSPEDFAEIYWTRMLNASVIAKRSASRLLVREHTHQYYFDDSEPTGADISWLRHEYQRRTGAIPPTVVSYRDPVDCWLGMKASFPDTVSYDFNAYCDRYLQWILPAIESARESRHLVYLIKYEDFCESSTNLILQCASALRVRAGSTYQPATVSSSGNSGRRNDSRVSRRPRRPYTLRLVSEALASDSYAKLCSLLDYRHLADEPKLQPGLHSLVRTGASAFRTLSEGALSITKASTRVLQRTANMP